MHHKLSFIFLVIFATPLWAQNNEKPKEAAPVKEETSTWNKVKEKSAEAYDFGKDKLQEASSNLAAARDNRAATKWTITGNYSVFETWVLNKYGVTFAYNSSPSLSYEFEYMKGSIGFGSFGIDIGEIKEDRFSFLRRSFGERKSLNFLTGIFYNKFDVHLGSDLLATVTGNRRNSVSLLELETAGITWGIGNRWQTKKGYVWGFDWFVVNMPLTTLREKAPFVNETTDPESKKDVKEAMDFFSRFPSMGVVKIQLGVSF